MANFITEFIQALDEEIEALKRGRGGSIVKVFDGLFLREVSGLYVYVFSLENFLAVLDESPAEVEILGRSYTAQVLLSQGMEVEVGLDTFCGPYIPEAKLKTNLWYLLDLLKKKYVEYQNGSAKADFRLSEILFANQQPIARVTQSGNPTYSSSAQPPNPAQKQAIESSFSSQLCVVWGPPGTGKTETISKAVEAHLNAGRRVLLVSHANNAVDEALEKVAQQLKHTPLYKEGKLVRLGKPQEEHLRKIERDCELVLLDKIALRIGQGLSNEKNALIEENVRFERLLEQLDTAISHCSKTQALLTELSSLQATIAASTKQLDVVHDEMAGLQEVQAAAKEQLAEAQAAGMLKRIFRRLDPEKLHRDIDQTSIAIDSKARLAHELDAHLKEIAASNDTKEREANRAKAELDNLLQRLGFTFNYSSLVLSSTQLETKKSELDQRKNANQARISEINRRLDETQKQVLSEARLVATTLTKTFVAKQFPEVPFDVLILDEASMAPLPHLYWAAGRCRGFVTVVGDFLQLPPICIANEKTMAKKWLGRSIFDVLGIATPAKAAVNPHVRLLDTQYRMAPQISAIPNSLFYDGMLKDDPSTFARKLDDGLSASPLVLFDTSTVNPWCSQLSTGSRFNLYQALVSATLARRLIGTLPKIKIGIVTPYAPQARLIDKITRDWKLSDGVRVSTVHKFQGGEESIMVFDSCESPGLKVAPMLDDTRQDSDARRVLNVAITRGKDRFYFIGHTKHLLAGVHRDSALARIVHHFMTKGDVRDSATLVNSYLAADFEKWSEALLPSAQTPIQPVSGTLFTERNFYAQFFQDIRTVRERLLILSPFLTVRRSGVFMDFFGVIVGRGVEVRVYTKPSDQQTGEMANQADVVIKQLRSMGVQVVERRNMHHKVAILDNSIAWEGSLNILSHRDSQEQMRRFEGSSAIDEIIRNLDLDEDMPVGSQVQEKCESCGRFLVVRIQRQSGRKFLGCSGYPHCRYTKPLGRATDE